MPAEADGTPGSPHTDNRPTPRYGELAPEGWEWKPATDERDAPRDEHDSATDMTRPSDQRDRSSSRPTYGESAPPEALTPTQPGDPSAAGHSAAGPSASGPIAPGSGVSTPAGRLHGVPHNLGAPRRDGQSGGAPAGGANTSAHAGTNSNSNSGSGERSYRASMPSTPPAQPPVQQNRHSAPSMTSAAPASARKHPVDRTATIALLAFGALGALYFAFSLQQMPASFSVMAQQLGASDLLIPGSVKTISTVGAIVVLTIYALNVVFSIQRLRAGKVTFWVPLVAFGVAIAVLFGCSAIALSQMPELLQLLSDPGAVAKLFDSLGAAAK